MTRPMTVAARELRIGDHTDDGWIITSNPLPNLVGADSVSFSMEHPSSGIVGIRTTSGDTTYVIVARVEA